MLPEVTPAVARALALAASRAQLSSSATIATSHLLHALFAEEEGRACMSAEAAGLAVEVYRRRFPPDPQPPAIGISLPLDSTTRAAFSLARLLAAESSGEDAVSGDLLLLAILRSDEVLRTEMQELGLQIARLEEAVLPPKFEALDPEEPLDLSERVEAMGVARLLDATANRAREGLRVAEDYCRFLLDDALLCRELKSIRHELASLLRQLPADLFLQSRDTPGDPGTSIATASEQERASAAAVATANLKRAEEALRSLEEFGKMHAAEVGQALEALRYRCYTIEKAIAIGAAARERLRDTRLYLLATSALCLGSLEATVRAAIDGGVDIVQLREKDVSDRELLKRAQQMRRWTREAGVLFIVNDRIDIARLAEADGVHLGQEDLSIAQARRLLGAGPILGVSTHNLEQLRSAILNGADYAGIGPTFVSATKQFDALAGLDFIRQTSAATSLPAFALGGIEVENIDRVIEAGARRIAVSRAILRSESPLAAARELRRRLK